MTKWFALAVLVGCASTTRLARVTEVSDSNARTFAIEAGRRGFAPTNMRARVNDVVKLVFTRTDDDHCLEKVVLHVNNDRRLVRVLPMHQAVVVTLRLDQPGEVGITCTGNGHAAVLVVSP